MTQKKKIITYDMARVIQTFIIEECHIFEDKEEILVNVTQNVLTVNRYRLN